jgi:aspartate carbamoyltransferase catalytic subunit
MKAAAFPDAANYRRVVESVIPALTAAAVSVYLVAPDEGVTILSGSHAHLGSGT